MDDQKRKVLILSIAASLVLGAGGYFVFSGGGSDQADTSAQQLNSGRAQRVVVSAEPEKPTRVERKRPDPKGESRPSRVIKDRGPKEDKPRRAPRRGTIKRPTKKPPKPPRMG